MTSVHERLQSNQAPMDKWSILEHLCLVSAVSRIGDKNWRGVSRAVKKSCVQINDPLQSRPPDWFSKKNCAIQYGFLLEDVKKQQSQKHSSESSVSSSPRPTEPPIVALERRLTEQRVEELKQEILKFEMEYAKLASDIEAVKTASEDQVRKMLADVEKEVEMERIKVMKMENQMRERELRKHELNRNWRPGTRMQSNLLPSSSLTNTTAVEMDVEEIMGTGKPVVSIPVTPPKSQTVSGTSPLLSSLLKSPTSVAPPSNIGTASVRSTAPTITTLLTGGSIPNTNQPAIIPSCNDAMQLLTRPLSGPPLDSNSSVQQQLLSPSQSAPTLSMLLEKNKRIPTYATDTKSGEINSNAVVLNVETTATNDSNNESIPMDIEEYIPAAINNEKGAATQTREIDDTDPNEEQQLLEVFKNIGNIEELDIDVSEVINEEVDFLKGVDDEETPSDENSESQQNLEEEEPSSPDKDVEAAEKDSSPQDVQLYPAEKEASKRDFESSDDSIANIPLANVASLSKELRNESSNESSFLKDQEESASPIKKEVEEEAIDSKSSSIVIKPELLDEQENIGAEREKETNEENNNEMDDISSTQDVFVMPSIMEEVKNIGQTFAETYDNPEATIEYQDQCDINCVAEDVSANLSEQSESNETLSSHTYLDSQGDLSSDLTVLPKLQPPPIISIGDLDENSSSTDMSVQTRKDDKHMSSALRSQHQRKSPHEMKNDDDMPKSMIQMPVSSSCSGILTPRSTALRKLRDRDRSESPMIDDDATTHSDHSTTTNYRSRRRYSSTPVIDSVPNSPASSDRDESRALRTYKKSLLSIFNAIQSIKNASSLTRVLNNEIVSESLKKLCSKQMDFVTIKRNIESGTIRNVYELQRDVLLLCQNALMVTEKDSPMSKIVLAFREELQTIKEFIPNGCESHAVKNDHHDVRDTKSSGSTSSSAGGGGGSTPKGRSGSRKSSRLS